jgi:hypothetical protein
MTKEELMAAADDMLDGDDISAMTLDEIIRLMTVTQYIADRCLNEVERRGALEWHQGMPIVPYCCEYFEPTVLTRGDAETFESDPLTSAN